MTTISYETDIVAWAKEQARLVRTGQFALLDLEHIAEEIEDVGKSEQRELASHDNTFSSFAQVAVSTGAARP